MTRPDSSAPGLSPLMSQYSDSRLMQQALCLAIALTILTGLGACSELETDPKKPFVKGSPSLVAGQFNTSEFTLADHRVRYMRTGINGASSGGHEDWFSYNATNDVHGFIRGFTYRFTPERWLGEKSNSREAGDRTPDGDLVLMADPGNNRVSLSLRSVENNFTEEEYINFRSDLTVGPYRCLEYSVDFDRDGAAISIPEVWSMDAVFNSDGTGLYTYLNNSNLLETDRAPRPFNYIQGSPQPGGVGVILISDASPRAANPDEPLQPVLTPGSNFDENFFAKVIGESFRVNCSDEYKIDPANDAAEGNGLERRVDERPSYCNVASYGAASIDGSVLFASRLFYEASVNRPTGVVENTYTAPSSGFRSFQSQQFCMRPSAEKSDASLAGAWWQAESYVDDGVAVTTFAELILNDQGVGESRQIDVSGNIAPRTSDVQFFVDSNGVLNFGGGMGILDASANFFIYNASSETGKRGLGFAIRQNLPPEDLAERIGETPDTGINDGE